MNVAIDISQVEIRTPRLILRPWKEEDLNDFYEYASVEGVGEMAGWVHHTSIEETKAILQSFISNKKTFALVSRQDQKVIGSLGIEEYDENQVDESFRPLACREIGYVLSKDYWGQGLMPEAVQAVIEYCFNTLHLDALFCGHFERNNQSRRVIEKSEFQFYRTGKYETRYGTIEKDRMYVLYRSNIKNEKKI